MSRVSQTANRHKCWSLLQVWLLVAFPACTTRRQGTPKDSLNVVVSDIHAVPFDQRATATSFVSDDRKLEVVFLDFGDDVGLVLRAEGNTLLHVDVNQDGKPTPRVDRSLGVDLASGKVCSWFVDSDPSKCDETRSNAKGAATEKDGKWDVSLRLPKSELGQSKSGSWVMFEIHSGSSGDVPQRFPEAEPFQKVIRLVYSKSGKAMGVSEDWPRPNKIMLDKPSLRDPHLISFAPNRKSVYIGEQVCIDWDVPNVQKVRIEPGFGEFDAKGRQCFNPEKTMTITLRANGTDGIIEKSETVQVKDVEIESFEVVPKKIRLGGSFSLEWHVRGATSLSLERTRSAQNSGSTFDPSVTSANTRIRVNATRKDFDPPGRYAYKLKADGPGGPKTRMVEVEIVP